MVSKRAAKLMGLCGLAAGLAWIGPRWAMATAETAPPPIAGTVAQFTVTDPAAQIQPFQMQTLSGREVTLADWAGQVVLLNLWATWCAPCVRELPSLARLQEQLGSDRFQVAAVSVDRAGARVVVPFLQRLQLNALPVYLDPAGQALRAFKARGLPTTLVIGAAGQELGRLEGDAYWDFPEAVALIQHHIEQETAVSTDQVPVDGAVTAGNAGQPAADDTP